MYYQVTCNLLQTKNGYTTSYQVPTFYLCASVQGIVDLAHAEKIAREVINPTGDKSIEMYIHVLKMG